MNVNRQWQETTVVTFCSSATVCSITNCASSFRGLPHCAKHSLGLQSECLLWKSKVNIVFEVNLIEYNNDDEDNRNDGVKQ